MSDEHQPFDLGQYEAADVATLEVKTPLGAPLIGAGGQPVRIHLYGPGSVQYQKAQAKFERAVQAATFAALRSKQSAPAADESLRQQAEKLAACTARVEHFPIEPLALYSNPKLSWITNQVVRFGEGWSNFLPQFAKD